MSLSSSLSEMTVAFPLPVTLLMVVLLEEPGVLDEVEEDWLVESFMETLAALPLLEEVVKLRARELSTLVLDLDLGIGLSIFRARSRLIKCSLDSRRALGMHMGSYMIRLKLPPTKT